MCRIITRSLKQEHGAGIRIYFQPCLSIEGEPFFIKMAGSFQLICANNRRSSETILRNSTYYLPEVQNYHAAEFLQQKYGENSTSYGND